MKEYFLNAAKRAYSVETESDFDCLLCGTPVRHPLCPHCIAGSFFEWTRQFGEEHIILCEKTRRFLAAHRLFGGAGVRCISCNSKRASICPSCFTEVLYGFIQETDLGMGVATEFSFLFNFDLESEG